MLCLLLCADAMIEALDDSYLGITILVTFGMQMSFFASKSGSDKVFSGLTHAFAVAFGFEFDKVTDIAVSSSTIHR
jgi:hypothetical protein